MYDTGTSVISYRWRATRVVQTSTTMLATVQQNIQIAQSIKNQKKYSE